MAESNNVSYSIYSPADYQGLDKEEVIGFLFNHLDEYGDARQDIAKCMGYALSGAEGKGGAVLVAREGDTVVGALILNNTGMSGYIPENILVYIAVHGSQRGKGVGKSWCSWLQKTRLGALPCT